MKRLVLLAMEWARTNKSRGFMPIQDIPWIASVLMEFSKHGVTTGLTPPGDPASRRP